MNKVRAPVQVGTRIFGITSTAMVEARNTNRISGATVARAMSLGRTRISQLESGNETINPKTLENYLDAINATPVQREIIISAAIFEGAMPLAGSSRASTQTLSEVLSYHEKQIDRIKTELELRKRLGELKDRPLSELAETLDYDELASLVRHLQG